VVAVEALVVYEIDLIDLLAYAAADLSANGSACDDAYDSAYGGAKYGACGPRYQADSGAEGCSLDHVCKARRSACNGADVLANFLRCRFGSD